MTLIELLIALCFTNTLAFAVEAAHHSRAGAGGYVVGFLLGLPLAFGAATEMYVVVGRIGAAMQTPPQWKQRFCGAMLVTYMLFWILFSALFADQVASAGMHLLGWRR